MMETSGVFSDVAARTDFEADVAFDATGTLGRFSGEIVSPSYFRVLGVVPARGRVFESEEADPAAVHPVAVVSDAFWRNALARSPNVIGLTMSINGQDFRIVGVTPPGFGGVTRIWSTDVWVPTSAAPAVLTRMPAGLLELPQAPVWRELIGRSPIAAPDAIAGLLTPAVPDLVQAGFTPSVEGDVGTPPTVRENAGRLLAVLGALVTLVLFLTTASLGNIAVSRVASRAPNGALRAVLRASRSRLQLELLAEFVVVGLVGAAAVAVARVITALLRGQRLATWLPPIESVPVDLSVMLFALSIALTVGAAAAWITGTALSRIGLADVLRSASHQASRPTRLPAALVACQLGISFALVASATVLARSMRFVRNERVGFETSGVVTVSLNPGVQGYSDAEADDLFRSLRTTLRGRPEIGAAEFTWLALGGRRIYSERVEIPGEEPLPVSANMVTPGFFQALEIPIVEGRAFDDTEYDQMERPDRGAIVVNQSLARLLDPDGSVVGRSVVFDPFGNGYRTTSATFVARSATLDADALLPLVESAVRAAAPSLPLLGAETLDDTVGAHFAELELLARLAGMFSLLATTLTTIAMIGLMSQFSAARIREFGIRRTLGARRVDLAGHVVSEGYRILGMGFLAGVIACVPTLLLLRTRLAGVGPMDPVTLAVAVVVLAAVTMLGTSYPALFASGVDPAEALRSD